MSISKTLQAWHHSMLLVSQIYHLIPSESEVSSNAQFKQSANAIGHYITEALGKNSRKSYAYNLSQANKLTHELQCQLKLALQTEKLHPTDYAILYNSTTIVQEDMAHVMKKVKERRNNP